VKVTSEVSPESRRGVASPFDVVGVVGDVSLVDEADRVADLDLDDPGREAVVQHHDFRNRVGIPTTRPESQGDEKCAAPNDDSWHRASIDSGTGD
jgi:hypothetical protein